MKFRLSPEHGLDVPLWAFANGGFFDPIRDLSEFPVELVSALRSFNIDWEHHADSGWDSESRAQIVARAQTLKKKIEELDFVESVELLI